MPGQPVSSDTTLVVLLGASEWPRSPDLPSLENFRNSADDIENYFKQLPFKIPDGNLLNLVDDEGSPLEINNQLSDFVTKSQERASQAGKPIRDLIVYYVGHGGFTKGEQAYFLAIRSTQTESEGVSSLRMVDLAATIKRRANNVRRYLILDCCFAEAAYQYYQSSGDPANVAHTQALLEFQPEGGLPERGLPQTGTALLCSSSRRNASIAPVGEKHTMFSGALLDVLHNGDLALEDALSLENVGYRVNRLITTKYSNIAVRPKVSSPDEREGNVAGIPLFPNAARLSRPLDERVANSERTITHILEKLQALDDLSKRLPELQQNLKMLGERMGAVANGGKSAGTEANSTPNQSVSSSEEDNKILSKAPPRVHLQVRRFRRAKFNGQSWMALSLLLSLLGLLRLLIWFLPAPSAYFQFFFPGKGSHLWEHELRDVFSWLTLICALFSLYSLFYIFPRAQPESPSNDESREPESWDTLPIVLSMRSSVTVRFFGHISVASPYFEIGAGAHVVTALVIILASLLSFITYY